MPRANRLPLDQRRAVIIAATKPLLLKHGINFSTKQVAKAAGIAEGTIFRAFKSMAELQCAVATEVMNSDSTVAALAVIDPNSALSIRIKTTIEIIQIFTLNANVLYNAMRSSTKLNPPEHMKYLTEQAQTAINALTQAVCRILAPDKDKLTIPLVAAAALLRSMAVHSQHPLLSGDYPSDPETLTQLFLHGVQQETK